MGLTGKTNEERIWNYLIGKGLSSAGAAGLMGNLFCRKCAEPEEPTEQLRKEAGTHRRQLYGSR